jgi:hypothetical protein
MQLARSTRNGHVTGVTHAIYPLKDNIKRHYMHLKSIVIISDKTRKISHLIGARLLLKLTSELRLLQLYIYTYIVYVSHC